MSTQSFLMALRSEKAAPGVQRRWRGRGAGGAGFLDLLWCFAEILPTQCFGESALLLLLDQHKY